MFPRLYLAWILTLNYSLASVWTSHLLMHRAPLQPTAPLSQASAPQNDGKTHENTLIPPQLPFGDRGPCLIVE